ncbi:hypothetical protein [Megasphaera massiliensis]|uniref:hypothetical protein n=1 Tax=Megasphaera massiliensis TaxID=1232428 RepID=UPI0005C90A8B|nr:hypothetical protein [Megasphaera massiliensis]MCQ5211190.1 hypothetical protein [Megasphaera massiliensis]DAF68411.1 MAG TPA: hypothetical protein [Caudoviricetes sp.]
MERKELLAWIKEYERKTNDEFMFLPGFTTWYIPERGFCQWKGLDEDHAILCWNLCNDAKFWRDALECVALQFGYDRIITVCILPIKAYIRYWGWKIEQDFETNGVHRYICSDKNGREVVCTPKENDDGTIDYYVTNELRRQYKPWKNANERS